MKELFNFGIVKRKSQKLFDTLIVWGLTIETMEALNDMINNWHLISIILR